MNMVRIEYVEGETLHVEIPVPYEQSVYSPDHLVLEPERQGYPRHAVDEVDHLLELIQQPLSPDGELARILTATVALFHEGAGPIAECLHTAMVWERG